MNKPTRTEVDGDIHLTGEGVQLVLFRDAYGTMWCHGMAEEAPHVQVDGRSVELALLRPGAWEGRFPEGLHNRAITARVGDTLVEFPPGRPTLE